MNSFGLLMSGLVLSLACMSAPAYVRKRKSRQVVHQKKQPAPQVPSPSPTPSPPKNETELRTLVLYRTGSQAFAPYFSFHEKQLLLEGTVEGVTVYIATVLSSGQEGQDEYTVTLVHMATEGGSSTLVTDTEYVHQGLPSDVLQDLFDRIPLSDTHRCVVNIAHHGAACGQADPLFDSQLAGLLRELLSRRKRPIDILLLDECYKASLETAKAIGLTARFLIAPEKESLAGGFPYRSLLKILKDFSQGPQELARSLVTSYHDYYRSLFTHYTFSCLDMALYDLVAQQVRALHEQMTLIKTFDPEAHAFFPHPGSEHLLAAFDEGALYDLAEWYERLLVFFKQLRKSPQVRSQYAARLGETRAQHALETLSSFVICTAHNQKLTATLGVALPLAPEKTGSSQTGGYL